MPERAGAPKDAALERARLEALVENIPDGLVVTDLRGDVLCMNSAARRVLGEADVRMRIQEVLKARTQGEVVELRLPGPDGTTAFFRTHVSLFQTPGGEELGVMVLLRDMTAQRGLDALKEEFFQSVAHDLRAPLFAMQGYLRLLQKSFAPDEKQKGYFDAIAQSCDKLMLFIQDTLDAARLDAGRMKLTPAPVEPAALVERVAKLFKPVAEEKGLSLKTALSDDAPDAVDVDERLVERVLHNLISNALKVTPRGGAITVRVGRAGPDRAEFSVSDTGPGIPASERQRIFDKFRQLDGAQRSGFGLGLNICAKIVRLHGGEIWVDSEPGRGSDFVFRLPIKQ